MSNFSTSFILVKTVSKTTFCSLLLFCIWYRVINNFWIPLIVSDICPFVWINNYFFLKYFRMKVAWKGEWEYWFVLFIVFFFQIKLVYFLYKVLFFIQPTKSKKKTHYKPTCTFYINTGLLYICLRIFWLLCRFSWSTETPMQMLIPRFRLYLFKSKKN